MSVNILFSDTPETQEFDAAWTSFWDTHDRLVSEGVQDVRSHPDYIAADQRCIKASEALHAARQQDG